MRWQDHLAGGGALVWLSLGVAGYREWVVGSVAAYVRQVDGVLGAAEALFPASVGGAGGVGRNGPVVPAAPGGAGLGVAVDEAGQRYRRAWGGVRGLDARTDGTAGAGRVEGRRGRAGAGGVRASARSAAAALAPATGSPAGVRLLVGRMEERLAAMQRQIDTTAAQNRLLALRLRQVAAAYRVAAALGGAGLGGVSGGGPTVAGAAVARRHAGPGGAVDEAAVGQGRIPLSQVAFAGRGVWPGGRAAIRGYLAEALSRMGITDVRARGHWIAGMMTIADHESGFRADAINLSDSNAHGPRQVDGGPLHATRGPWQVMPDTFAAFHQPGTSNSVWDPVAAACASMNYQMSRYGVSRDGGNERALVGQANPGIRQCY